MFRYYISFSHRAADGGTAMASVDVKTRERICSHDDLAPITADLRQKGYANVTIISFSLYGVPKTKTNNVRR